MWWSRLKHKQSIRMRQMESPVHNESTVAAKESRNSELNLARLANNTYTVINVRKLGYFIDFLTVVLP
jgi:hypothetical protein